MNIIYQKILRDKLDEMNKQGISTASIAAIAGVSQSSLCRFQNGKDLMLSAAEKVAEVVFTRNTHQKASGE